MAGTALPIDRERTAELLGFAGIVENAMDAVSARDHLQEAVASCAICMTHLSRMAAELVLWSSSEFGFVRLDEAHATGSSIMPQKRNPDAAELVRGKAGRVYGDLQALLTMVKGLPLAYNRDLQEDKQALFDGVETTTACLRIMGGVWRGVEIATDRFERELEGDPLLATELADLLVERGVPFREAHEVVGNVVRWCEEQGGGLEKLTPAEAERFHPQLTDFAERLDPRNAAERRTSRGGTAWVEIERQIAMLREA
jgi:argininosuccinate lyase